MTLYELIENLERTIINGAMAGTIVRQDARELNSEPSAQYPVIAWQQNQHQAGSDYTAYRLTLFYIDRLDDRKANLLEVQSVGIEVLRNLITKMEEFDGIEFQTPLAMTPFNYRFTDECGGAYCDVTFLVDNDSICADQYQTNHEIKIIG